MKKKPDHLLYPPLSTRPTVGVLIGTARVCPIAAGAPLKCLRDAGLIEIKIEDGRTVHHIIPEVR